MLLAVVLVVFGIVLARVLPGLAGWGESIAVIGSTAALLVALFATGQIA